MVIAPASLMSAGNSSTAAASGFTSAAISLKLPFAPDDSSLEAASVPLQALVATSSSDPRPAAAATFHLFRLFRFMHCLLGHHVPAPGLRCWHRRHCLGDLSHSGAYDCRLKIVNSQRRLVPSAEDQLGGPPRKPPTSRRQGARKLPRGRLGRADWAGRLSAVESPDGGARCPDLHTDANRAGRVRRRVRLPRGTPPARRGGTPWLLPTRAPPRDARQRLTGTRPDLACGAS